MAEMTLMDIPERHFYFLPVLLFVMGFTESYTGQFVRKNYIITSLFTLRIIILSVG